MTTTSTDRTSRIGDYGIKAPCVAASTAALTLSGNQTIDGVACVTGDRVLVKDQTSSVDNGIYVVDTGTWTRAVDCDGSYDLANGTLVKINSGTTGTGFWYASGTNPIVVGSSAVSWAQASTALAVVSAFMQTMLDDADAATARTTLVAAKSGANTDITSLSAPELAGATATTQAATDSSTKVATTAQVASAILPAVQYYPLTSSAAAGNLTATLAAGTIIRWPDGTLSTLASNTSVTAPSGQTLGSTSTVAARLWVAAIYNGGTPELALVNTQLGSGQIFGINEATTISTTAIATAATAGVWYSTTARATQKMAIVGYVEATQTAGAWASASKVQGMGLGIKKPGDLIQTAYNYTGAVASGATTVPNDDTIPQSGEGNQFMTQAITPSSAINTLRIRHLGNYSNATSAEATIVALFQDATANALAAQAYTGGPGGAGQYSPMLLNWDMVAGTTSATTLKIRAGGTASTVTFNGQAAARKLGGSMASMLSVDEVMA